MAADESKKGPAEDDPARSIALLEATGLQILPLAYPGGHWPLLAVSPRGFQELTRTFTP